MSRCPLAHRSASRIIRAMLVGVAMLQLQLAAPALAQQVTMETLLDRIQIEDLLVKYYYDLASGRAHEMSEYNISSDSGLPDRFDQTFKQRDNPLPPL